MQHKSANTDRISTEQSHVPFWCEAGLALCKMRNQIPAVKEISYIRYLYLAFPQGTVPGTPGCPCGRCAPHLLLGRPTVTKETVWDLQQNHRSGLVQVTGARLCREVLPISLSVHSLNFTSYSKLHVQAISGLTGTKSFLCKICPKWVGFSACTQLSHKETRFSLSCFGTHRYYKSSEVISQENV